MLRYLFKKALELVPTFLGITIITFFILHLAPGKPTDTMSEFNPKMTPEARLRLEKYYGLDKPIVVQYGMWLKRLAKFDFGESFSQDRRPVWDKINERMPITILINALAIMFIFLIAIPIGVSSAIRQNSLYDKLTTIGVFIGFATPTFWLALMLQLFLGVYLGWFPISGIHSLGYEHMSLAQKIVDSARHLTLPIFISVFGGLAGLSRYMRSQMLEVIRQEYIVTARAKGLPEKKVIYKHALKNALLPVITILGLSIPGLLGGSIIFETIFAIPGMGQLSYMSVMTRDYPLIMALLVIDAILVLLGNLLADIGYAIVDPRIRVK
ncbi:MAG: ABC transporter permease [Candidatus Omnitrophota bacterium]|nr:ABC transporter permease [Candidatus Omnitrophota bacterium]